MKFELINFQGINEDNITMLAHQMAAWDYLQYEMHNPHNGYIVNIPSIMAEFPELYGHPNDAERLLY